MDKEVRLNDNLVPLDQYPAYSYKVKDLQDPSKMHGIASYKFKFPRTKEVERELGSSHLSESVKTATLRIGNGTVNDFSGDVYPTQWSETEIEARVLSNNALWFKEARNLSIRELNLGTEQLTVNRIRDSWRDGGTVLFGLIDFGALESRDASTYVIPQGYIRPSIKVIDVLAEGFKELGFGFEARGRIKDKLTRAYLPSQGKIDATESYLQNQDTQFLFSFGNPWADLFLNPVTSSYAYDSDLPAGSVALGNTANAGGTGGNWFVAPFNMNVSANIKFQIATNGTPPANYSATHYITLVKRVTPAGQADIRLTSQPFLIDSDAIVSGELDLGTHQLDAGEQLSIIVESDDPWSTNFGPGIPPNYRWYECDLEFTTDSSEYVRGIEFEVSGALPDWKFNKLVKNMNNLLGSVTYTEGGTVFMEYLSDYYNDNSPRDFTDRMITEGRKLRRPIPSDLNLRYTIDDSDRSQLEWEETQDTEYGSKTFNIPEGENIEQEVKVDFAATWQGEILNGISVPIIRTDGKFQEHIIARTQRILLYDGVPTPSEDWQLQRDAGSGGVTFGEYPEMYFDKNDAVRSLAFESVSRLNPSAGSSFEYVGYVDRLTNALWDGVMELYDDELKNLRGSILALINGNIETLYIQEIKRKRVGDPRTRVILQAK